MISYATFQCASAVSQNFLSRFFGYVVSQTTLKQSLFHNFKFLRDAAPVNGLTIILPSYLLCSNDFPANQFLDRGSVTHYYDTLK